MGQRFRGPVVPVSEQVLRWADPEIFRLVELADRMDMSGFDEGYRADGCGGVRYDPRLMLVTVWWCQRQGVRGPQDMARMCREQVSLRAVWQRDQVPSAAALRRFIGGHPAGWRRVQVSMLACCDQAGLMDLSVTATDSTPVTAPAALARTLSPARITVAIDEVQQQLATLRRQLEDLAAQDPAGFVDTGCGPLYRAEQLLLVRLARLRRAERVARERGASGGDRQELSTVSAVARLREQVDRHTADLARMTERQNQAVAAYRQKVAAGCKPPGPAPHPPERHPHIRRKRQTLSRARARLTAAEQATPGSSRDGPAARANITDPDSRIIKGKNQVRWVLGALLTVTVTVGQIITAALLSPAANDYGGLFPNLAATSTNCRQAGITTAFGHHLADAGFACPHTLTSPPPIEGELLVAVTNEHDQIRGRTRTTHTEHRRQMTERLNTADGQALYRRRSPMIEPVFAHLLRTDRRLHTRGPTQHCEILAMITSYNATKYLKHAPQQNHPPKRRT